MAEFRLAALVMAAAAGSVQLSAVFDVGSFNSARTFERT